MSGRRIGDRVRVEMTKWGDRPHWSFEGRYLGADEYGEWIGFPPGTHHARPGAEFDSAVGSVTVVRPGAWHVATLQDAGIWCDVYVDITGPVSFEGDLVRGVDLDLDVIRMASPLPDVDPPSGLPAVPGVVLVDDEDEFDEHRVAFGYPDDVVRRARASCSEVLAAVRAGTAPYDDATARHWLGRLAALD